MLCQHYLVVDKEKDLRRTRGRGRPRSFDVEAALDTAESLFHRRGYGGVKVAELADALEIKPPSLYAAFGSKAALFERCVDRYTTASSFVPDALSRPDVGTAEAMAEIFVEAARRYAADPGRPGCLVIDGARHCEDPEVTALVRDRVATMHRHIAARVAQTHPGQASAVASFVVTTMRGMSAAAREGASADELRGVAHMAADAVRHQLRA